MNKVELKKKIVNDILYYLFDLWVLNEKICRDIPNIINDIIKTKDKLKITQIVLSDISK